MPLAIMDMAERIEDKLRLLGWRRHLQRCWSRSARTNFALIDEVAYMRFASVYKNFDDAADFKRELALLAKTFQLHRALSC